MTENKTLIDTKTWKTEKTVEKITEKTADKTVKITSKGYVIPADLLTETEIAKLKSDLTVKPAFVPGYGPEPEAYMVYRSSNLNDVKKYYVPKFYGLSNFNFKTVSSEREGLPVKFKFNGSLKNDQIAYVNSLLIHLAKNDAAIACAPTGAGKTVMTIYIISKIGKKTLIIVHKEFLLNQWVERIAQFMPDAKVSFIRGPVQDTSGDIVIAMLQSLSMKEYEKTLLDDFGLVCIDETHHIVAQTFSKALIKSQAKKMLGLSATPDRADGLTKVLNWFLGPIISKDPNAGAIEKTTVRIVPAKYREPIQVKYNYNGKPMIADLINKISSDPDRNAQIVSAVEELHKTGRNIIVLSDRRGQCIELQEMLTELGIESGLYLGSMSQEALTQTNNMSVILATYSMAAEGYDNAKLDTLVFATGKSNVVQSCGRILRRRNEQSPLIVDIADVTLQYNQVKKRKVFYKQQGYLIVDETRKNTERSLEEVLDDSDSGDEAEDSDGEDSDVSTSDKAAKPAAAKKAAKPRAQRKSKNDLIFRDEE
jgi:superfamily II DNA or RNA helicase